MGDIIATWDTEVSVQLHVNEENGEPENKVAARETMIRVWMEGKRD